MNCIGGFLLKYTKNYEISLDIFNFVMKKFLEPYFRNDFFLINKLLFVSEKLIRRKNPGFLEKTDLLGVGLDFFFSPLLLTLFTASLQNNSVFVYNALFF